MSSKLGASLLGRGGALNHSGPGDDVLELDYDADIGAIAQAITPGGHDAKPKGAPGGTPFLRAVFLLSNCILGSGILGQAYAMRHSGWAVFVVSLLLMSSVAAYGAWLLLCCCETTGVTSYEEIGTAAYGKWGKGIATAAILIQNASAMTSYLVILGDLLPTLVREAAGLPVAAEPTDPIWANRAALMTVVAVVVIIPLVSLRNIGTLGYSSGLSIAIMVFFAIVAIVTAFNGLPCPLPADRLPATLTPTTECEIEPVSIGLDTFYVLPSLAFSFVCHTGLLPIYTELRRRDRPTMMRVAGVSMASCLALYLIAAIFGYAAFRGSTASDALKSMTAALPDDGLVTAARVLVCVSVTVTVPLINYPARKAITLAAFPGATFSWTRHVCLGVVIVAAILLVAIFVPDVRNVFGAAGATSSVTLMAILPGLFYSKLHTGTSDPAVKRHVQAGVAFAVLGAIIGVVSFAGVIMSWVDGGKRTRHGGPDLVAMAQPPARVRASDWAAFVAVAVAFTYSFFQRAAPSSMAASLQQEFDVDGAQLGALSSAYFWPYLGMQFVLGYLFLRFGVDAVVCASMTMAAAGSLVFALSESLGVAVLGRCLIGSGVAAAWLGVVTVAQGPAFEQAGLSTTVTGAGVLFGLAGALLAQTPLTSAIELFGFRPVLLWSTVAPAVVAVAFFARALIGAGVCCRDTAEVKDQGAIQANDGGSSPALDALLNGHERAAEGAVAVEDHAEPEPEAPPTVLAAYWAAVRSPVLLPTMLYGFGIAAPLLAFASLWATPFFEDVYDLDKPTASAVVSAFLVGWGVGGPVLGWLVDRLGGGPTGAQWVLMLCPIVGGVALTPVLLADLPVWAAATLMAVAGLASCIAIVLAYTRVVIVRPEGRATAVAIVNAAMILAGASLQPAIGIVLDGVAGGRIHELPSGRKVYPPDAYRWALMVLPGCYALSTLSFIVAWCVCGHGMARKERGDGTTPPLLNRSLISNGKP